MSNEKELDLDGLKEFIDSYDKIPWIDWSEDAVNHLGDIKATIKELEEEREHCKKAVDYYLFEVDKVKELKKENTILKSDIKAQKHAWDLLLNINSSIDEIQDRQAQEIKRLGSEYNKLFEESFEQAKRIKELEENDT